MNIGTLALSTGGILAPMAGVTDRAFREICIQHGAVYVIGEMASAKGLYYNSPKTGELLTVTAPERPMAVQLFGDAPDIMAHGVTIAEQFSPDVIDINMGCPAPKVTSNNSGSALMKDLPLAERIIQAAVKATDRPVTVKIRSGWDDSSLNAVETAQRAERAGAAAITVHGRTRQQMYAPPVNYEIIQQVKKAVSIPVIGNGDIADIASAKKMLATGCDGIMVGRGAMGNPWIFSQLKEYFSTGTVLSPPTPEEKMTVLLEQIRRSCQYKGEYVAMKEARSHAAWYLRGLYGAAALRRQASQLSVYSDLQQLAEDTLILQEKGKDFSDPLIQN